MNNSRQSPKSKKWKAKMKDNVTKSDCSNRNKSLI